MEPQLATEKTIIDRMIGAILFCGEICNMLAIMSAFAVIYVASWPLTRGPLFWDRVREKLLWPALFIIGIVFLVEHRINDKEDQYDKDRASAMFLADDFRLLYNTQSYATLYEIETSAVKGFMTQEQFIRSMQASMAQLGKYKSSTLVASSCFPTEVRLVYHSEYEKGKVTEWMVWSHPQDGSALAFYRITPGYDEIKKKSQSNCPI